MIFTEKYTRGVSAVESILTLDRLRQSVAIKELEQTHGQPLSMRKTVSVPNFSQVRSTNYNMLRIIILSALHNQKNTKTAFENHPISLTSFGYLILVLNYVLFLGILVHSVFPLSSVFSQCDFIFRKFCLYL